MTLRRRSLAAKQYGAAALVDPRPFAVGSIQETFAKYPNVGELLPAMGYGPKQMEELRETIERSDAELVLIGTPIDLRRIVEHRQAGPPSHVRLQELGEPTIAERAARARHPRRGARSREQLRKSHTGAEGRPRATVVALGGNALLGPASAGRRPSSAPTSPHVPRRSARSSRRRRSRDHPRQRAAGRATSCCARSSAAPRPRRFRSGSRSRRRRPRSARSSPRSSGPWSARGRPSY